MSRFLAILTLIIFSSSFFSLIMLYNLNLPIQSTIDKSNFVFGGSDSEQITNTLVDDEGYIYICGWTSSADFPTINAYNATYGGESDIFLTKLSADGQKILKSTFIGGSKNDYPSNVILDNQGYLYISGRTTSSNFPMKNAYNTTYSGDWTIFIAKFSTLDLNLEFSSFIGGKSYLYSPSFLSVDTNGNIYLSGITLLANFSTFNAFDSSFGGDSEIFIIKISNNGQQLMFSTFIGGIGIETVFNMKLDKNNNIFLIGTTTSSDFPTKNAFNATYGGGSDGFLLKLSSDGQTLLYSSFVGGSGADYLFNLEIDDLNFIILSGYTSSANFPLKNAFKSTIGENDGVILKFFPDGQELMFSTFVGGSKDDQIGEMKLDQQGNIHVLGWTESSDFPTKHPFDATYNGETDLFLTTLLPNGTIVFSTYLGGSEHDAVNTVFVFQIDEKSNLYLTGRTYSPDFPTLNNFNSSFDGFRENPYLGDHIRTNPAFYENTGDSFFVKISFTNKSLVLGTFPGSLGGNKTDSITFMVLYHEKVYITGRTGTERLFLEIYHFEEVYSNTFFLVQIGFLVSYVIIGCSGGLLVALFIKRTSQSRIKEPNHKKS